MRCSLFYLFCEPECHCHWIAGLVKGWAELLLFTKFNPSKRREMSVYRFQFFFVASSSIEIHSTFGHKRAPTRKKNQRKFPIYTKSDIMSHWMWYEKSYNDACHWFRTAGKKTNWSEKRNLWLIILANDGLAFFCSVAQRPHRACISEVLIEFNRHFLWPWDVRYLMSHRTMDIEYSCNGMQSLFFSHSHNRPYGEESVSVIVCEPMHYRLEF